MGLPLFAPRRLSDGTEVMPTARNVRVASGVFGVGAQSASFARGREIAALLLWTAAAFLTLALASYVGDPNAVIVSLAEGAEGPPAPVLTGANWVGPVGESCARAIVTLIGVVGWSIPLEFALLGIPFVRGKKSLITPARLAGDLLIVILGAALVQVGWPGIVAFGRHPASGAVGELFGELARSLFSTIGSFLVGFACLGLILIARASFSFIALMHAIARFGARGAQGTAHGARSVAEAWKTARQIEREKRDEERRAQQPHIETEGDDEALLARLPSDPEIVKGEEIDLGEACGVSEALAEQAAAAAPKKRTRKKKDATAPADLDAKRGKSDDEKAMAMLEQLPLPPPITTPAPSAPSASDDEAPMPVPLAAPEPKKVAPAPRAKKASNEPVIVDTSATFAKEKIEKGDKVVPAINAGFRLPTIDFLIAGKVDPLGSLNEEALLKNAELLVKTLADYGVSGKVEDIVPGPTVTTFEVSPAAGTKVSKVAALADDLALALAKKVRIVAPIPGKNRIGFELPNERRVPVNLRDLVEDRRFQTFDAPLPVVLGRDIRGNPVYADLASMPHVIVAGATGAGKSVGLNVMLTSLLYRRTPEELRLLMIDPKVVELAPFDRIPHMLLPVVTDMKQASNALKWAVDEMERRYQLFADAGTRNIGTYNGWVERVIRGEARNPLARVVIAKDHNGLPEEIRPENGEQGEQPLPEKLPSIVIVVDEFADLMMQQGKEVEAAVARLAQKARAAGMHVILATQRPSVDVITGMIKANFPTRIAFRVAQKVDSRTILDEQGAEHLLGRGDMLIKLNGTNETKRVQCPFLSEEEVQAVTDFLRLQGEPVYDDNILKPRDDDGDAPAEEDAEQDAMYDEAVRLVAETRRCSTSWLQRKLMLGYNRAARIVEMMERRGLVGPANGAKDREVLISAL
jgi:S-DNA-T family DNA segregation ATPase FtsK/SpoIIIE